MDFEHDEKKIKIACYVAGVAIVAIIFLAVKGCSRRKTEPIVMPQEQTTDTQAVENQLDVSQGTAEKITREIRYIQTGETQPQVTYYVTAPTVEQAADKVAQDIKDGQPTVPKEAAQKSDRTVVTADKDKQKVDVYKINLNKAHKLKAGVLTADGKTYGGIGYQAGRLEGMVYTRTGRKIEAAAVTYTIAEW